MRLRDKIIMVVCLFFAAVLFVTAGMQLDYINSQRQEMKLIINEPLENAPPSLAFATVAMGAFRGLVVDILWLRAERLKQNGQFFDARQLAEWITALQPRFASVWEFQSWNMAYNISVAIPATQPEQRWQWVRNGYELVRDKGLVLNPKSILLYRQIAFIFQHKIGGVTDDVHKYYKLQLARSIAPLLGAADGRHFKSLAEAPWQWEQIINDPNISPLIEALKSADEVFADDSKFVDNYLALRQRPEKFKAEAFDVIDYSRGSEGLAKFDIFAKAWHLRNTWKLDPALMQELNQLYGPIDWNDPNKHLPLDWRHPHSHAIYWAVKGLREAGTNDRESADEANTDRIVAHSLHGLFRNGKIFIYEAPVAAGTGRQQSPALEAEVFLRPDLRMFEPYNKAILNIIEKYTDPNKPREDSHRMGHRNMLINAIFSFYQAGHTKQAEKLYRELRERYPRKENEVPLVIFVRNRLNEELQTLSLYNAQEMVQMLLRESYFRYAMREDDESAARENWAKEAYDRYTNMYLDENRINLPDMKLLRYLALMDFLNDTQYPPSLRESLIGRIRIEKPELGEQLLQQQEKIQEQTNQSNRSNSPDGNAQ